MKTERQGVDDAANPPEAGEAAPFPMPEAKEEPERPASLEAEARSEGESPAGAAEVRTLEPGPVKKVGLPAAFVLGAAGVALVHAGFVVRVMGAEGGFGARVQHHAFDFGHLLAIGFASAGLAKGLTLVPAYAKGDRTTGRFVIAAILLFMVCAAVLAFPIVYEDVMPRAITLAEASRWSVPWACRVATLTASLCVPIAGCAGVLLGRRHFRWLALVLATAIAVLNNRLVARGYPGLHLYAAWSAILVAGFALADAPALSVRFARLGKAALVIAGLWAFGALAVHPRPSLIAAMLKTPGTVAVPFLSRLRHRVAADVPPPPMPEERMAWYRDRNGIEIPPTSPAVAPEKPIVVLLTVDAFRADALFGKEGPKRMPFLTELRHRATAFTQARTPGAQTAYTFPALFTGKYFSNLYWSGEGVPFPDKDPSVRFTGLLGKKGVATGLVVTNWWFDPKKGIFGPYASTKRVRSAKGAHFGLGKPVSDAVIAYLEDAVGKESAFVSAHYFDAHQPYQGKGNSTRQRYLSALTGIDKQIARVYKRIGELGLQDRTIFIIASDHGEAFGEHNTTQHGYTVYDEMIRVPLLIEVPKMAARQVDQPVSIMDLGPTILDLFQVPTPGSFLGQSLVPLLRGDDVQLTRPVAAESRMKQMMIFPNGFKAIRDLRSGSQEIYNLKEDPEELENLIDDKSIGPDEKMALLSSFFDVHRYKKAGYSTPFRL